MHYKKVKLKNAVIHELMPRASLDNPLESRVMATIHTYTSQPTPLLKASLVLQSGLPST